MGAARDTVAEKLDNMRNAYESHGGGIRGAAAAALEGVKGIYTAGFSFLDNLTGGRLTAIKDKFVSGVMNIASGVRERFESVRAAFTSGLNNVKNTVTGAVSWFYESGKKVISTFANGIKSAFSGAVDAVKGGLQRIRNKCRVLTGGTGPRTSDWYSGGTPTNNEWDRFTTREEVISGLPAPLSSDLDSTLNSTDKGSTHNQFWNWMGVYSWCQEVYSGNSSTRAVRGYPSARRWNITRCYASVRVRRFSPRP